MTHFDFCGCANCSHAVQMIQTPQGFYFVCAVDRIARSDRTVCDDYEERKDNTNEQRSQ